MNDDSRQRFASLLAWRAFPRSAGIIVTIALTLTTHRPIESLGKGLVVWLVLYAIRELDDHFVDRNIWSCCSTIVFLASLWIFKSALMIIAAIIAISQGTELGPVLLVFGGLLIYDLYFTFNFGS